ncbi:MAG: AAA family ATPase [Planctomycetia bacterium]
MKGHPVIQANTLPQPAVQPTPALATAPAPSPASTFSNDPFSRIIGQRRAVPFLKQFREGICFGTDHHPLLFLGRSGHGKTSLAKAFADSISAEFIRIDCGPELKSEHLVERLTELKSLAVVFCDEMQSMRKRTQEVLYSAIDSRLVPALNRGRLDRCAEQVPIESFVLIGATNEPGRLLPALRARMINVIMEDYSDADLRAIAQQKATRFFLQLSSRAIDLVVRASGGSPRTIVQILQSVEVTSASWRFNCDTNLAPEPDQELHQEPDQEPDQELDSTLLSANAELSGDDAGDLLNEPVDSLVGNLLGGIESPIGRDHARSHAHSTGGLPKSVPCMPDELVERALTWMGLDLHGLDATARTLLATMAQHTRATAELLSTVIGLDVPYTRQALAELRARQFTQAAPGVGWVLTDAGRQLVKDLGLDR